MVENFKEINPSENRPNPEHKKSSKKEAIVTNAQIGILRNTLNNTIRQLRAVYRFVKKSEEMLDANPKMNRRKFVQEGILLASAVAGIGIKKSLKNNNSETQITSAESNGIKTEIDNIENEFTLEEKQWLDKAMEQYGFAGWTMDTTKGIIFVRPPMKIKSKHQEVLETEKKAQEKVEMLQDILIKQWEDNGKINIGPEVKEEIKTYWKIMHKEGGARRPDLEDSLKNLKPWYTEIKEEFNKVSEKTGVVIPEKLIYLCIPESYCRNKAISSAAAVGFFQLMAGTARGDEETEDGLVVNKDIDERLDVPENARRAAEYLVWLYKQSKGINSKPEDTWRLVLAGYNGVYFNNFKKDIVNEPALKKYNLYLTYRENNLNEYLDEVFKQGYFENYRVQKGETLEGIAKKCKVNLLDLQKLNNKATIFVQKGEKIRIPVFRKEFEYMIQPEDNLWEIAKRYGLKRDDIASIPENASKIGNNYFIKAGDVIKIIIPDEDGLKKRNSLKTIFKLDLKSALENLNYPEKLFAIYEILEEEGLLIKEKDDNVNWERIPGNGRTLKEISKLTKLSLKSLGEINPHIKGMNARIPKNVDINIIPKSISDKLLGILKIKRIKATKVKDRMV